MTFGKTAKTKKAIVTLTADSKDIEIFGPAYGLFKILERSISFIAW